ncbi:MAG: KH domain-containing protein [Patescibacteria group bacterium]|nr:KH domain-containing protein [Patescibacteria group bacterium]
MTDNTKDQEFVEYIVKALVDHPEDVKTGRTVDEMGVLITLDVHSDDMGMVIGREGATAKSIRTLLRVVGAKNNARVNLKINEPEGSRRGNRPRREDRENRREEKKGIEEVVEDLKI